MKAITIVGYFILFTVEFKVSPKKPSMSSSGRFFSWARPSSSSGCYAAGDPAGWAMDFSSLLRTSVYYGASSEVGRENYGFGMIAFSPDNPAEFTSFSTFFWQIHHLPSKY